MRRSDLLTGVVMVVVSTWATYTVATLDGAHAALATLLTFSVIGAFVLGDIVGRWRT